ncbi:hypothetical protein ACFSHR_05685 [Azotobacter chroococcum]
MSDYDINTIYPPREDLFIGDIYANIYTPNCNATLDNNECTFTSIRIARIPIDNISKMIPNQHDNTQPLAPEENGCQLKEIKETDQKDNTKKYSPSKECFTRDTIDPSDSYQHLKQIAFPNFYKHTGNSSQASTAILTKILPKAGIGINNIKEYSVAIPTARYYSVNPFEILDALQNLPPEQSQKLQQVKDYKEMVCSQCKTKIFIPYQIYYTRELDITYKGEFFTNRKYSQTRNPNEPRVLYTPPTDTNDSTNTSSAALIEENSFGVTTTLSHASTGDIGVRQVFDTPMAIGYKGFVYDDHEEIKNRLAAHHKNSYEQPTVTASEKSPHPALLKNARMNHSKPLTMSTSLTVATVRTPPDRKRLTQITRNPLPTARTPPNRKRLTQITRNPLPTARTPPNRKRLTQITRNPLPTARTPPNRKRLTQITRNPLPTARTPPNRKRLTQITRNPLPTAQILIRQYNRALSVF